MTYEEYVLSVVRISDTHREACLEATGATGTSGLSALLRWPGYVGRAYPKARIRLLCAAQVHHGPELLRTGKLVQGVLEKIAAQGATSNLLSEMAKEYERAITKWGPWADFEKITSKFGIDETGISYTNVAKCWQTPSESDVEKPMKACAGVFPLEDLAVAIDAQAILLMSSSGTVQRVGIAEKSIPIFNFKGRPSKAELEQIANQLHDRFTA